MKQVRPQSGKPAFGVWGYEVPKSLHQYKAPSFSIKKDQSSFFDLETKELKRNPAPGQYETRKFLSKEEEEEIIKKRREPIDKSKLPKRPFFMD